MPWLIKQDEFQGGEEDSCRKNPKDDENGGVPPLPPQKSLFFVHVPRCGGTSLMHYFHLPQKVQKGRSLWGKLGMMVFFSRYKTLEARNFPIVTWGNAFALAIFVIGLYFVSANYVPRLGILLMLFGIVLCLLLTVVFTAPVIGRFSIVHHSYLIFVHYILCRFMESIPWCTGTNKTGYIMHLTANKLLSYQYVTYEEFHNACSMAIVRNPYSRMVSIYTYNRFGEWESFPHFIEDWYNNVTKAYRTRGELEEWYTPCHAIPQFEYTHSNGKQLVKSIIKQEELKYLKDVYKDHLENTEHNHHHAHNNNSNNNNDDLTVEQSKREPIPVPITATGEHTAEMGPTIISTTSDPARYNGGCDDNYYRNTDQLSISNLPPTVRDALLGMPHSNQRQLSKKWYEYYTQRTLDLVYEIYHQDFDVFSYSPILPQRPDLQAPKLWNPPPVVVVVAAAAVLPTVILLDPSLPSSTTSVSSNGGMDIEHGRVVAPVAVAPR
jgi:hypothetical protein